jgi:hypothetical protein
MPTLASRLWRPALWVFGLLVVVELASRLALSSERVRRHIGREDPTVQRINWVYRRAGSTGFNYPFDVYDSLLGWAVQPGVKYAGATGGVVVHSTPRGVRGTADVPYDRVAGRRRILVFGDSYTFGDELSDQDTWAAALGRLLTDADVVNLGVHGFGHDQMLEYLKTEGVKYRPDVVMIGYVWFDQYRNLYDFTNYAKPRFELRGGRLELTNVPVPRPEQVLARDRWRSRAWDAAHVLIEMARWKSGANDRQARAVTEAILDELAGTTRAIGAVPLVVYLPVLAELDDTSSAPSAQEQFLQGWCNERGVACLMLQSAFARERGRGARFPTRGHWNPAANLVAARAIAAYLGAHGLADTAGTRR